MLTVHFQPSYHLATYQRACLASLLSPLESVQWRLANPPRPHLDYHWWGNRSTHRTRNSPRASTKALALAIRQLRATQYVHRSFSLSPRLRILRQLPVRSIRHSLHAKLCRTNSSTTPTGFLSTVNQTYTSGQ